MVNPSVRSLKIYRVSHIEVYKLNQLWEIQGSIILLNYDGFGRFGNLSFKKNNISIPQSWFTYFTYFNMRPLLEWKFPREKLTCAGCPVSVPPCGLLLVLLLLELLLLLLDAGLLFELLLVEGSALVCAPGAVPFCLIWGLIGGTVLFPVLKLPPTMPTEPGGGWT